MDNSVTKTEFLQAIRERIDWLERTAKSVVADPVGWAYIDQERAECEILLGDVIDEYRSLAQYIEQHPDLDVLIQQLETGKRFADMARQGLLKNAVPPEYKQCIDILREEEKKMVTVDNPYPLHSDADKSATLAFATLLQEVQDFRQLIIQNRPPEYVI